jgi:hypothetical protein
VYNDPCIFYPNLEQASATVNDHLPEAVPRLLGQRIKKTRPRNQFVKETLDLNRDPRSPDTALPAPFPQFHHTRTIMFRPIANLRPRTGFLVTRTPASFYTSTRLLASKPKTSGADSGENGGGDDELDTARRWLANFDAETIPRSICDVSFSRSSGPGGQNVNKYIYTPQLPTVVGILLDSS